MFSLQKKKSFVLNVTDLPNNPRTNHCSITATNSISRVVEQQRLQLIEMTRLNSWWHLGQVSNDAGCNKWSVVLCKDPYPAVIDDQESVVTTGLDEGVMVMTLTELDNIVTSLKDFDVKRKWVLRLRLSNK